jgi:hypothetical protein
LVFLSSDNDDNNVIRKQGKVRDIYNTKEYVIIVATDRQSAFDRNLAGVPFKVSPLCLSLPLSRRCMTIIIGTGFEHDFQLVV